METSLRAEWASLCKYSFTLLTLLKADFSKLSCQIWTYKLMPRTKTRNKGQNGKNRYYIR